MQPKLYVLVRSDLSKAQQAVQAGHAVAEFCRAEAARGGPWRWTNGTLVYLRVRDLEALREWHERLENCCPFFEPYYKNQMTAFAILGKQPGFEELPLM